MRFLFIRGNTITIHYDKGVLQPTLISYGDGQLHAHFQKDIARLYITLRTTNFFRIVILSWLALWS